MGPSWLSCIQWNLSIEDTIGTQLAVLYTVEALYRHHWDPDGCPVYSGRTPLGPRWLSCIQWKLSIEDTIETQLAVLYTVGPSWQPCIERCPLLRDTFVHSSMWSGLRRVSSFLVRCPLFQNLLYREVPLYVVMVM